MAARGMLRRTLTRAAAIGWIALAACGDETVAPAGPEPLEISEGCNPIGAGEEGDCLLPYPSDFFRTKEGDGFRVTVPEAAQLRFDGVAGDPLSVHRPDGFSVGTPILTHFPGPLDDSSLVFWTDDVARSKTAESPTVILDAETGEPVLHFAELDAYASTPERQALILRPLERLKDGHRYVVGIGALKKTDGSAVSAPAGFASLRDEEGAAHPSLAALASHYDSDVFPVLEAAGRPRAELLLAWDFTTRSEASATSDLLGIRDAVIARYDAAPPEVTVVKVEDDVAPHIGRRVELTVKVPMFVDSEKPGGKLEPLPSTHDAEVPVTVWIPPSVMNRAPGDPPARLLQFGHGFFGDRYECDGFPAELADEYGFVVFATDWWGMAAPDKAYVAGLLIGDPTNTIVFTDRVHQAYANALAAAEAAIGPIALLPELQVGGTPAYDASHLYFYGISMGHILGSTYVAISPRVERAVLSVGGANFSMMMFRALPFQPLLALLQTQIDDPLEQQKFAAIAQSGFDRIDPVSYAPYFFERPLAGAPADRKMLQHVGIADSQVPNVASYFHARIYGLPALEGAAAEVPAAMETVAAPTDGSAFNVFDFGETRTDEAIPPPAVTPVHEGVRRLPAAMEQVDLFLRPDGQIENTCTMTCDPE